MTLLSGSDPLAIGDSFDLFNGTNLSGSFDHQYLPVLGSGLGWNTDTLESDGILTVMAVAPPFEPEITRVDQSGTEDLVLTWTSSAIQAYTLQLSTNAAIPEAWADLPPHLALPGVNGSMTVTGSMSGVEHGLLRIKGE